MKRKKLVLVKRIIRIIVLLLVIGASSFYGYNYFKNKDKVLVPVYSVEDLSFEDYFDNPNTSDGVIREFNMQSIYASDTEKIEKILVSKGQRVTKGTPILEYSTFLTDLEIERKEIEYQKLKIKLSKEKDKLEEINDYVPYKKEEYEPNIIERKVENTLTPAVIKNDVVLDPLPLTGDGVEDPYLVLWEIDKPYNKSYINKLFEASDSASVTVSFMTRNENKKEGDLIEITTITFNKEDSDYTFNVVDVNSDEDPIYRIEIIDNTKPEPDDKFTKYQISKMKIESLKNIKLLEYDIKSTKYELDSMKTEKNNNRVISNIDGVIKIVRDKNTKNKPVVVISAGGGYIVSGTVNETNKDKVKKGMEVEIENMMSGETITAKVDSISNKPTTNNYYSYGSSPNLSSYPYTVKLKTNSGFKVGDWVNLKLNLDNTSKTKHFYLNQAFVLEENNKYYVYVSNKDNKLEKREIFVGKNMDGALEIIKGITKKDKIAFPYGKEIKDGVNTKEGNLEEFYSMAY